MKRTGYMVTHTSYAGSDMIATLNIPGKGAQVFGELSSVAYSIDRPKVGVRSLGRTSIKGFTRGMRTVSGILSFTMFDESIVLQAMKEVKEMGYKMLMDEMPMFDITISMANEYGSRSKQTIYGISTYSEGMALGINNITAENVYQFQAIDVDPMTRVV